MLAYEDVSIYIYIYIFIYNIYICIIIYICIYIRTQSSLWRGTEFLKAV